MPYVNYHRHSMYSNVILPDSTVSNEDYCKRAKELGHTILSSCEHGTPGNYRQCADLAAKYGLKWRYVAEGYFVKDMTEKDKTNCHIVLAAKTAKGIGDINEAISKANIDGYYYRARLDINTLLSLNPNDIFITTACVGGVWNYAFINEDGTYDWTDVDAIVMMLYRHFKNSMMLEVQYHNTEKQKIINRHILQLHNKLGIPLIAGMDSHFIYPQDSLKRDSLLESRHLKYEEQSGWYMDYPSDEQAVRRFKEQDVLSDKQIESAMNNTAVFETFEDVVLDKSKKLPTIYPELTQEQRNEKYRQIIREKWLQYRKNVPRERWDEYQQGIKYEVDTITSTNTSDYFLLDYEIVKRFNELGGHLTKTGRGSAPSYFTNALLGFSSIDRFALPITMYPDRFISADRLKAGSLPDIDMNVADPEIFAQAQAEVMGDWHSAPMIAYGTLKRLSSWKMYCRAKNVPFEIANAISDNLSAYELACKHAEDASDIDVMDYIPSQYYDLFRESEQYMGVIDSLAVHPCAFVVCNFDVRREFGVFRMIPKQGKKKEIYAAFIDGATADAYGYLKNDNLKVDVVKVNADIYDAIGMKQPSVPQLLEMVKNDEPTWSMYRKGLTIGLNQMEKEKSREKVMTYSPRNISEMSAICAGIRPAFQSMLHLLINRQDFSYGIPALDRLLRTKELPQSFILYQEQMMTVLQWAGFSAPESYSSIKAIAKKHPEKVLPLKERFLNGFKSRLVNEEHVDEATADDTAAKVWTIISDACGYGFNSCVTGDTVILRNTNGSKPLTVEQMYEHMTNGFGYAFSLCSDGRIRKNDIIGIYEQGIRKIYKLKTEGGREVRCTDNHKFPVGTSDNLVQLKDLKVGDKLFFTLDCDHSGEEKIISIEPCGEEMVYDVEMADPNHNFVLNNGMVIGNSHATAVALDSIYTAWAKAHYPYETYVCLLRNYSAKGDKDRIDLAKKEMSRGFGIQVGKCKFHQDNRDYFVDKTHKLIADSLTSIKGVGKKDAEAIYNIGKHHYNTFVDVLLAINKVYGALNTGVVETLIKYDYFDEYGKAGKLMEVYEAFYNGKNKWGEQYTDKTKDKRLAALREIEANALNVDIPIETKIRFEIEKLGTPTGTYPEYPYHFAILQTDVKYSPKIYMYSLRSGKTGMMKMKKDMFARNPLNAGDLIELKGFEKKQAYQYVNNKAVPKKDVYDFWIKDYEIM